MEDPRPEPEQGLSLRDREGTSRPHERKTSADEDGEDNNNQGPEMNGSRGMTINHIPRLLLYGITNIDYGCICRINSLHMSCLNAVSLVPSQVQIPPTSSFPTTTIPAIPPPPRRARTGCLSPTQRPQTRGRPQTDLRRRGRTGSRPRARCRGREAP